MSGPRPQVVTGAVDTPMVRALLASTDVPAGRLALQASAHHRTSSSLVGQLLDVLGVTGSGHASGRAHDRLLSHALPWLLAYDIRLLLVHGYARVPPQPLELLADLADAAGVQLWLTGPSGEGRHADLLRRRGALHADLDALRAALSEPAAGGSGPEQNGDPPWPAMPGDDFLTFRAAMRQTLTEAQFAAADRLYRATVAEAHTQLPVLLGEGDSPRTPRAGDRT